jgi:hypothetical protein
MAFARSMAKKEGILKNAPLTLCYYDADNDLIRVEDDNDLQTAYCIALSSDKKIKFIVNHAPVIKAENKPVPPLMMP